MLSTYHRLNLHVSASWRDVVRAARRKIAKKHRTCRDKSEARKSFYRVMLKHHHDARELCRTFKL
jgi:uncharacterized protein (DUF305 family)